MTGEWITPADREYFQKRYPKTWAQCLDHAVRAAVAFAEQHAPLLVQFQVAHLHLMFGMQTDAGDRRNIMRAIDAAIEYGRWADDRNQS